MQGSLHVPNGIYLSDEYRLGCHEMTGPFTQLLHHRHSSGVMLLHAEGYL